MLLKVSIGLGALLLIVVIMFSSLFGSDVTAQDGAGSIYEFKIPSLTGEEISFDRYKGKNLLIVNTASKCGYTYQYADLEKLHEQYGDKVEILGFPANNFLWQEPGTNEEIAAFCEKNYGVKFQMFDKISVKGNDKHPLYRWLEAKSGKSPSWNFCKYVINSNGEVIGFFPAKVSPLDAEIISLLQNQDTK